MTEEDIEIMAGEMFTALYDHHIKGYGDSYKHVLIKNIAEMAADLPSEVIGALMRDDSETIVEVMKLGCVEWAHKLAVKHGETK